ncbi:restriction endonuclease subunit S [Draconibacterium sediminis]|uniref:Type I restriction modification DNA specificity domain-containing protein n=1 Tax=Draconibacterium sediminis TaxID=1544798 RepID=A0A0D8JBB5_9BACT|nr:restriction endonuclease subunit S [Draconibacterium sediminis]KJF44265.1 hypothetical protein LH29_01745 [Draconibacterium sediminis]
MGKELPTNWINIELEQLFLHVIGGDWGKDPQKISDDEFVEVICIRGSEIKNWEKDKGNTASVRAVKNSSLANRELQIGDILLEISGGGPDQPVGRTVYIDEDVFSFQRDLPRVCTNFLRLVRIVPVLNKKFINHYLQYFYKTGEVVNYQGGSNNLRNLKFKDYSTIQIPLPPLPEQNHIVEKLDVLFGHLEQIKSRWQNFQGKVNDFVESCLVDEKTKKYYQRKTLEGYLEEGTERIGEDWEGKRKVGISAQKGIIDLDVGQKKTFEKYKIVRPGDFVYNAMRVNIGSIGIYEGNEVAITSPDYIVFRVTNLLSPRLLLKFLKSKGGLLEISANTQGSVRSRLYFKYLINIKYPVAPEKIQKVAERFLEVCDSASIKWQSNILDKIDSLKQSVLTKAFKGELVEQLPTDGDARELLAEIKKAKSELSKPSKPKGGKVRKMKGDGGRMVAEPGMKYGK